MKRMHTPEPKLPPDAQDKRSVVPIAAADAAAWLFGSILQAAALVRPAPLDWFEAGPETPDASAQGTLL